MGAAQLGLYTTVHPACAAYLEEWIAAAHCQTDSNFTLWLGVDGVGDHLLRPAAERFAGRCEIRRNTGGLTPAELRVRVLGEAVRSHPAVVLADADDCMSAGRVADARKWLEFSDVVAFAMEVVDAATGARQGRLGPSEMSWPSALLGMNAFGFGNTAFRSRVLARCLQEVPRDCEVLDWWVSLSAWAAGASMRLQEATCGVYRQRQGSPTQVCGTFQPDGVTRATEIVQRHLSLCARAPSLNPIRGGIESRMREVAQFGRWAGEHAGLAEYCRRFSESPLPYWWASVACGDLKDMWK